MANSWSDYQDEAACFFRTLGLAAETNVTLQGSRTSHDVDVVVTSDHVGFQIKWLVECKHWQDRVSKLHVLGLRQIVIDVGADRGIMLCEAGFQSGAFESATLTNVTLTSLSAFQSTASGQIQAMRARDLFDRTAHCRERYWKIAKPTRIQCGLRPGSGELGYSGDSVILLCEELLSKTLRGVYPLACDSLQGLVLKSPQVFSSAADVLAYVEPILAELEAKIDACENYLKNIS
jgi:hypothetical protein